VETATQTLHRLTSYMPGRDWDVATDDPRIVQDLEANDMARLPWFFKRYAERMPRLPLPRELPATSEPAVAVLAGRAEVKPTPLDLPNLSRLLYLSAGVVRTMDRDYGIHPFRAAGSAGGRFPLEHALASGMTFLDSEVPALLGEPLDGLLFTCVGVPRYPNAPAGPPGAPSRVRRVTPAS
jgi:hypothetical protein